MRTKLFILVVAVIGVPTASSLMSGREAMNAAYDQMTGAAYSIQMTHWRPANRPKEDIIEWDMNGDNASRACTVCLGSIFTPIITDCNIQPCFRDIEETDIAENIKNSWKDPSTLAPWESVQKAIAYQVYKVSDGICYLTGFSVSYNDGRHMKCFTNRFIKNN